MQQRWGLAFGALLLTPALALAQAVVEHATITAGTGVGTAGSTAGVGQSIGGIFQNLNKTLGQQSGASRAPLSRVRTPGAAKTESAGEESAPVFEPIDPSLIKVGLPREELVEKFGEPMVKYANQRDGKEGEVYLYSSVKKDQVEIFLENGKVAAVSSDQNNAKKGSGVLVLQ